MRTISSIFAASLFFLIAATAHAGVVLQEQETVDRGNGKPETQERTVMVQGNQQKTITDRSQVLIDLDKGSMYIISPERKAYVEMAFPPEGKMGQIMARRMAAMNFKKTGKHQTVAGYACDEYTGGGDTGTGKYSVVGCFSKSAPGAADFTAFQKAMADKLKSVGSGPGNIPSGLPLEVTSTSKMTSFNMPGISADQAAKIKDMLAKRPPVTNKTIVTKVTVEQIAASDFTVPAGYQKQEMPQMPSAPAGGHSGGKMSSSAPSSSSASTGH
ncbi:MAG TPA: DUF4412 domain-containing protein [Candidatus Binataceae bacterium]|nr:DUF4412 domain-containing protein [Candidatus Binataceae bacterium]